MTPTGTLDQQVQETPGRPVARPAVEIIDSENEIVLTAEMPGVNETSADVSLEKNVLTIRGRSSVNQPEGFEEVHREWIPVDFERAFTLSDEINRDGIDATVKNGVLTLRLPKTKEAVSRKIRIKAG